MDPRKFFFISSGVALNNSSEILFIDIEPGSSVDIKQAVNDVLPMIGDNDSISE